MSDSKLGILYIVATPIGNLADMSLRAQEVLGKVDYIAAEDTRHTRQLLSHFGISQRLISLHDYNEDQRCEYLVNDLNQGLNIALVSDAGTPLISDPGYVLVRTARAAGISVVPIPGPCAVITALSASGLPTDRFVFEGFLPVKSGLRLQRIKELQGENRTIIFYESVHRILEMLSALIEVFGNEHFAVIARELTKRFETIRQGSLGELTTWLQENKEQQRGEFVVLLQGNRKSKDQKKEQEIIHVLKALLKELPLKQAVSLTAEICQVAKNEVYQLALNLKKSGNH